MALFSRLMAKKSSELTSLTLAPSACHASDKHNKSSSAIASVRCVAHACCDERGCLGLYPRPDDPANEMEQPCRTGRHAFMAFGAQQRPTSSGAQMQLFAPSVQHNGFRTSLIQVCTVVSSDWVGGFASLCRAADESCKACVVTLWSSRLPLLLALG